jgi:hypothetical protein
MKTHETVFYRIERTPISQDATQLWRGKAKITRKDSGEVIGQVSMRYCASPDEAERRLDEDIQKKLGSLPSPPIDWGKESPIPALINRYLALRDRTYGFFVKAEETSSPEEAKVLREEGDAFEAAELYTLKQEVTKLSDAQKVELVTPTPQQKAQKDDAYVLDILTAKKILYYLIDDPTPQVKAGYLMLEELLNAE